MQRGACPVVLAVGRTSVVMRDMGCRGATDSLLFRLR